MFKNRTLERVILGNGTGLYRDAGEMEVRSRSGDDHAPTHHPAGSGHLLKNIMVESG